MATGRSDGWTTIKDLTVLMHGGRRNDVNGDDG